MNKYLTPILTIILIALGSFQAAISDGMFADVEKWQLAALTLGAIVTYAAPLTTGRWPAVFKVGGAVIGAAIATIIGFVEVGTIFDMNTITIVVLAALNALAAQTGADARVDEAAAGLADPGVPNAVVTANDPVAAQAAAHRI